MQSVLSNSYFRRMYNSRTHISLIKIWGTVTLELSSGQVFKLLRKIKKVNRKFTWKIMKGNEAE